MKIALLANGQDMLYEGSIPSCVVQFLVLVYSQICRNYAGCLITCPPLLQGDVINYRECSSAEEIVESSVKLITFLDLAGHQKYLHTTIFGLTGYSPHYSLLVVGANCGVAGTTREHLILSIALQVPFFVVVTKTDITPPSVIESTLQSLEALIGQLCKRNPYRVRNEDDAITVGNPQRIHSTVPIFLVSNVSGKGLHLVMKYLYVLSPCLSTKERERLEQVSLVSIPIML